MIEKSIGTIWVKTQGGQKITWVKFSDRWFEYTTLDGTTWVFPIADFIMLMLDQGHTIN